MFARDPFLGQTFVSMVGRSTRSRCFGGTARTVACSPSAVRRVVSSHPQRRVAAPRFYKVVDLVN
jgi:hypothetical protein